MSFIESIKEGFKLFGDTIAYLVNSVLLFVVYVVGVGISALFVKLAGKELMRKKTDSKADTYWVPLNLKKEKMENYYRQF